jgi:hypothetical protein
MPDLTQTLEQQIETAAEPVLHLFACDCLERLLWRHRYQWDKLQEYKQQARAVLKLKKAWLDGKSNEAKRKELETKYFEYFQRVYPEDDTENIILGQALWAALSSSGQHAASSVARAARRLFPEDEQWQLERLTWLQDTYQWAGDRMPFLLEEDQLDCPSHLNPRV